MHLRLIFRVLGVLLMVFSLTLMPPVAVSLWYQDHSYPAFLLAFFITFVTGLMLWLPFYSIKQDLHTRDGFVITALFWSVLGSFASLPFVFAESPNLTFTDALFESLSGLTTTGATVITGLDHLPKSILYYRQQLQWLGGIGIIVIAVAILPMLGIGGMQLYRTEAPGPIKDSKLTPRITETAKALFLIYSYLTVACTLAYWAAGMTLFDAIGHSYATVSAGGLSTHDASIGYFDSPAIIMISTFFMLMAGINHALHFLAWREKNVLHYINDPECRFYFRVTVAAIVITAAYLTYTSVYPWYQSVLYGSFELVSILTTTGFGVADFTIWPAFLPFLLFYTAFFGGCAGSTGGGMKMVRMLLVWKQGMREIARLIHPNAVIAIKLGSKAVPDRVVDSVWGFFAVYVVSFAIMFLVLLATGLDFTTSFSAVGACINNLGPGLGEVSVHYGDISGTAKWVLCFAMLLGRLEVFTLLVLFTPTFWRR
ncbi:TrkH family potassium uptake protein [Halioxenophilus sp. WMMB6]|uniref:TrkH family potassium uptake protein n=1 Tax=Halioxenophilus sp. WMMB6 TaxID=3073815 RepID=UPI00295EEE30|nr:TrkH family potassium uptake protein [Halioxenophilus sp. WMMB6]